MCWAVWCVVLLMAALGIPKCESNREEETGLPQTQGARRSFPLPSKSPPVQETTLARDMVVIFSLIFMPHMGETFTSTQIIRRTGEGPPF